MNINRRLKRILSITLATLMILGVMDFSLGNRVFANGNGWDEIEDAEFEERIVIDEDLSMVYIEIETMDDINYFMNQNRDKNLGYLNSEDIGKKILLNYDGNEPLTILERDDVIAISDHALDISSSILDNTTGGSLTVDLSNVKLYKQI